MHPIRLLILAILFYLIYRILFGGKKNKPTLNPELKDDTLEQDPVCHTYIPRQQAVVHTDSNGTNHFFCSTQCRDRFIREQAKGE